MNQPKKMERRRFIYAGLGAIIVIVGGIAAYFATKPPAVVEKTVVQTVSTTIEKPVEKVITTTVEKPVEKTIVTTVAGTPTTIVKTEVKTETLTTTIEKTPTTPTTPTKAKIRFFRPGTPEKVKSYVEPMIKEFQEKNPNVDVSPIYLGWPEYQTKIETMVVSGQAPDCGMIWIGDVYRYAEYGALIQLDEVIPEERLKNYEESLLDGCRWKGKLYGLPYAVGNFVLVWHKDVFEKAGLDPERPPKTWDEVIEFSKQIKKNAGVPGLGVPGTASSTTTNFYQILYHTWSGKPMYDEKEKKPLFTEKEGLEALQMYYDLAHTHKITVDDPLAHSRFDYRPLLRDARIGMTLDGPWPLPIWKAATDFSSPKTSRIGLTTLPEGPISGYSSGPVGNDQLVVFTQTKHRDAAIKFILHASSIKWQYQNDIVYGYVPARKDEAQMEEFKKWYWEPFVKGLETVFPVYPKLIQVREFDRIIYEMVQKVLAKKLTPKEALQEAEKKVSKLR
jgi:multiple sugar transport system substrate-binding protein